ncbi:MAG: hypothetical protein K1X70_09550 [Leptospirales bacterium]|nr:hypothetical protein [Leptospirales bacterium]
MPNSIDEIAIAIDENATVISALELVAAELNIPLNASPLVNFRDALFHYVKLYPNQSDPLLFAAQSASISEHLARGLKDMLLHMSHVLRLRLLAILNTNITVMNKPRKERVLLVSLVSQLSDLDLEMRRNFGEYNSQMIGGFVSTLRDVIADANGLIKDWGLIPSLLSERLERTRY